MTGLGEHVIEPAVPADTQALAGLHAQSFPRGWDADSFVRYTSDEACLMLVARAAKPGSISGLLLVRKVADEAEILTLAVAREARCMGLGRRLLEAAIKTLKSQQVKILFLEVGADNHAARTLYERLGFRDAGHRSAYYEDGQGKRADARIMRLEL